MASQGVFARSYSALGEASKKFAVPAFFAEMYVAYLDQISHYSNPGLIKSLGIFLTAGMTGAFLGDAVQFFREGSHGRLKRNISYDLSNIFSFHNYEGLKTGAVFGCAIGVVGALFPAIESIAYNAEMAIIEAAPSPQRPTPTAISTPAPFNR